MEFFNQLEDFTDNHTPIVLTIGNFDGVHRAHSAIFRQVKSMAGSSLKTMVLTFKNHPSEVLRPGQQTPLICTIDHRIKLIQEAGIDNLMLLPFTKYLADHSAASFVERLRQFIPFTHLVLGYDATLGRDRQGNRKVMEELGHDWGFDVKYLEEFRYEGHPVSSSRIRELLQTGNLEEVEILLGRPYSIYTIHCNVKGLCLPPTGEYAVLVKDGESACRTVAKIDSSQSTLELDGVVSTDNPIEIIFET